MKAEVAEEPLQSPRAHRPAALFHLFGAGIVAATALVVGRASWWWSIRNWIGSPYRTEYLWPPRHLFLYTLPTVIMGAEAILLLFRLFGKRPKWISLTHVIALGSSLWMMHWSDATERWWFHINAFDRQRYFGNTVWLWLLAPACVVLLVLAVIDSPLLARRWTRPRRLHVWGRAGAIVGGKRRDPASDLQPRNSPSVRRGGAIRF